MLRWAVVLLVMANAAYFAWTQGYLDGLGWAPVEQREPQRMAEQVKPDMLRLLNGPKAAVPEPVAPTPAPATAAPAEPAPMAAAGAATGSAAMAATAMQSRDSTATTFTGFVQGVHPDQHHDLVHRHAGRQARSRHQHGAQEP